MPDESSKLKLRWLLAILDGFWALGILLLGYLVLDLPLRVFSSELDKLNLDVVVPPQISILLLDIVPEAGWELFIGILSLAVAYGRLSFSTQDSITNRLFRWSVAVLMFMLASACLPLFDLLNPLPMSRESSSWLDEAAFVALSLSLVVLTFTKRAVDDNSRCS
ncbi:MAG: hypothetical protein U1F71_24740 [Verrucomicrobiaceae bacterium]